jgi:hypothetical protein
MLSLKQNGRRAPAGKRDHGGDGTPECDAQTVGYPGCGEDCGQPGVDLTPCFARDASPGLLLQFSHLANAK